MTNKHILLFAIIPILMGQFISEVSAQKKNGGTPLEQVERVIRGQYPGDDINSDAHFVDARRNLLQGKLDASRDSVQKAMSGKYASQAQLMQSAILAARYEYQESLNALKQAAGDSPSGAMKAQAAWLEASIKNSDAIKKIHGREYVKTFAAPSASRHAIYLPDAGTAVFMQGNDLVEAQMKSGKRTVLMSVPNDGRVLGVTTSIFPKLSAVSVFIEGRYVIKVSSADHPVIAKELQDRLLTRKTSNSICPFISMDGQNFLFSSDRDGGSGGFDIYLCTFANGKWTDPVNVGSAINSEGNELYPFLHPDMKSLYFSSNGHSGFGGYDLFHINLADSGYSPTNLGMPVNDAMDQAEQFSIDLAGARVYRSISGRIIQVPLQEKTAAHATRFVYGTVKFSDKKTNRAVTIKVDGNEGEFGSVESFPDGRFSLMIPYGKDFTISPISIGYLVSSVDVDAGKGSALFYKDFDLPLIYKGMRIQYVINFAFNSAQIEPSEQRKLLSLIRILKDNPHIQFELSGHSDDLGSDDQNMSISKTRIAAVIDNLVSAGINAKRLNVQAYGQKKSIIKGSTDFARRMNRRVEISVVSWEGHEYAYGGDYRSRLEEVREELKYRRGLNFRIPAYIFWGLSAASFGGGVFYTLEANKEKKTYDDTLSYYQGTNLVAWHNESRGDYQSKLDAIYNDYERNYNYSIYCYTAGGVFLGVGVFFFVWDYINKGAIVELEKEEQSLQKIGFDIQFDPTTNRGRLAVVYRF